MTSADGLRCVAAVVYSDCSGPLAAISVSGVTSRVTDERLPVLGKVVREVADELTVALGGVMPRRSLPEQSRARKGELKDDLA